jgi:hypothetical protein
MSNGVEHGLRDERYRHHPKLRAQASYRACLIRSKNYAINTSSTKIHHNTLITPWRGPTGEDRLCRTVSGDVTTCLLRITAVPLWTSPGEEGRGAGLCEQAMGPGGCDVLVRVLLVHWSGRGMGRHPWDAWSPVASWGHVALLAPRILQGSLPLRGGLGKVHNGQRETASRARAEPGRGRTAEATCGMAPAPQRMS